MQDDFVFRHSVSSSPLQTPDKPDHPPHNPPGGCLRAFVRMHKALRVTPAMAGLGDQFWEIADIARLVEDAEVAPNKRGPYKKERDDTMAAENLTPAEVTELCTAAKTAWNKIGPLQTSAKFKWRGKSYVATHSTFRLMVHTPKGEPVAARYD